jgi:hypothetical protein
VENITNLTWLTRTTVYLRDKAERLRRTWEDADSPRVDELIELNGELLLESQCEICTETSSARARSRVQGCRSSRNHSIGLDPVGELSGFPLVTCPDCGMARVVEGRMQKEGENHDHLYFKCARNSVSSLLCLPNLS